MCGPFEDSGVAVSRYPQRYPFGGNRIDQSARMTRYASRSRPKGVALPLRVEPLQGDRSSKGRSNCCQDEADRAIIGIEQVNPAGWESPFSTGKTRWIA